MHYQIIIHHRGRSELYPVGPLVAVMNEVIHRNVVMALTKLTFTFVSWVIVSIRISMLTVVLAKWFDGFIKYVINFPGVVSVNEFSSALHDF